MAPLDRLHADQEGMSDHAPGQDRRRQPAGARIAPSEVRHVCRRGGGIQDERNKMHSDYFGDDGVDGAK